MTDAGISTDRVRNGCLWRPRRHTLAQPAQLADGGPALAPFLVSFGCLLIEIAQATSSSR
jgi:hypothetical protein